MFPTKAGLDDSLLNVAQGNIQLRDANLDSTPEELNPLKEALERALLHKDEAAGIREALEAEVMWAKHCLESSCHCIIQVMHQALKYNHYMLLPHT